MVNATFVEPYLKSTVLLNGLFLGFASAEPPLGNPPYRVIRAEPPHPKGLTAPVAEAPPPVPRPLTRSRFSRPFSVAVAAAISASACTSVLAGTNFVERRINPDQRGTTILVCHLRWKGVEEWNPGRVSR